MNPTLANILRGTALGTLMCAAGIATAPAKAADTADLLPQMGFNNWNSTHCRAEFDEAMIRGIADKFISLGLKDAGYRYVNVDDCWANWQRDKDGHLQPNPKRFPSGIAALADYIHQRGLKFGVYSSAGTSTCEPLQEDRGFPGGLGHEVDDAKTIASWHVDYLKYDNCNNQKLDAHKRYTDMANALRNSGRQIFFSMCEWGENKPWLWASKAPVNAGSWRTTGDITDTYASMLKIFKENVVLDKYASLGHWNDPDMLEVGNGGMTDVEYRSHFSLWSIMASPLLIGTDLRTIKPDALQILLNKDVIAIDQDPLGVQGHQVRDADGIHVIVKPLKDGGKAVAVFNEGDSAKDVSVAPSEIGLKAGGSHTVRDLWAHTDAKGDGAIKVKLEPHATVMYRISK
ncbi:glycoside hydrolase family 27 protein [Luteibacter aegosomaticola]|uniref:glycoside hydrolase family 27 protein n=1 Tax=Luteibacter aegosomaticola TaxID=2911538 RepID=UPI001FF94A95|nr:glycoside hydrolase family 27 protein [Luteibacter aegosomaticola]UPG88490.1 glycoside hydrolase family 27 protein [Luteibacter aegosomaticola]